MGKLGLRLWCGESTVSPAQEPCAPVQRSQYPCITFGFRGTGSLLQQLTTARYMREKPHPHGYDYLSELGAATTLFAAERRATRAGRTRAPLPDAASVHPVRHHPRTTYVLLRDIYARAYPNHPHGRSYNFGGCGHTSQFAAEAVTGPEPHVSRHKCARAVTWPRPSCIRMHARPYAALCPLDGSEALLRLTSNQIMES